MIKWSNLGSLIALSLFVGTSGVLWHKIFQDTAFSSSNQSTDALAAELSRDVPLIGSRDSAVKVVMFGDYECGPCRSEWKMVESYCSTHKNIAVYFFHLPLEIHPYALASAIVSEKLRAQDARLTLHRMLMATTLSDASLDNFYTLQGLSTRGGALRQVLAEGVARDVNLAHGLGISGTPCLLVADGPSFRRIATITSL